MTKAASIHEFWSSFGIAAYEESAVPSDAEMPYITYELVTDSAGEECAMSASLWYGDTSWVAINEKTEEISSYIGIGGVMLMCDGGRIRIRRASPFAVSVKEKEKKDVRHKALNVFAMYLTHN